MPETELTPKQQRVLNLLTVERRTVKQAAKTMKITESAVYGHMRRLRDAGYLLQDDAPEPKSKVTMGLSSSTAKPVPTDVALNGHDSEIDVPTVLRSQIERTGAQIKENHKRLDELSGEIQRLEEETDNLTQQVDRHESALKVYSVK